MQHHNTVPHFWVLALPALQDSCPNAIYFINRGTYVDMYVTDQFGNPFIVGQANTSQEVTIASPDDSITINQNGQNFQISVSQELQEAINNIPPQDNTARVIYIPELELSGIGTEKEQIAEWINLQSPSIIKDQFEQLFFEIILTEDLPQGFRVTYNNNIFELYPDPNNIETWKSEFGLPTMTGFYVYGNTVIMQGDFSGVTSLEIANANNNVEAISGLEFLPDLTFLGANGQNLKSIDISQNTSLEQIELFDNKLTDISIDNNVNLNRIILTGNSINNSDVIDAILQNLVDNGNLPTPGISVIALSGSPNMASPSLAGYANKSTLIGQGYIVFTN